VASYIDFLKSLAAYYTFIAQQQPYFCEEIKLNINTGDITVLLFWNWKMCLRFIVFLMVMPHRIKKRENFINLCYHTDDFGTDVDWHFFTSRGKDIWHKTMETKNCKACLQNSYE